MPHAERWFVKKRFRTPRRPRHQNRIIRGHPPPPPQRPSTATWPTPASAGRAPCPPAEPPHRPARGETDRTPPGEGSRTGPPRAAAPGAAPAPGQARRYRWLPAPGGRGGDSPGAGGDSRGRPGGLRREGARREGAAAAARGPPAPNRPWRG